MLARSGAPAERVLIYRLGSLGDTVAALPCFHLIERAFPAAERIVLTNVPVSSKAAALETILGESGLIHRAIPYPLHMRNPRELMRLAATIRAEGTKTMVYLAASRGLRAARRDVAFFRFAGVRTIIGAPTSRDLQFNRVAADGTVERESARLARTLERLGQIDLADRSWWDLRLSENERARGSAVLDPLGGTRFVAVNMGGKAAEKDWGEDNWHATLALLSQQYPSTGLVFIGAREDSERAGRLAGSWSSSKILNLCGAVSPRESAAVLEHAMLFIGHDSGPLHLADAVGAPAVGLFGDYNRPEMWHPSGATTRIIHRMQGLQTITPDDVRDACLAVAPA
ncbi:MAG: glycosyltransferase family 9 protein [Patulibacter sp.]